MSAPVSGAVLLDASVLVELVTAGVHVDAADRLLAHLEAHPDIEIVTAAHGLIEALSALRRLNLNDELSDVDAATACSWLKGLDLRLDPTAARLDQTWALRKTMTAYDAAYAAAAAGLGYPLVTVDRPLLAACLAAKIDAVHLSDATW